MHFFKITNNIKYLQFFNAVKLVMESECFTMPLRINSSVRYNCKNSLGCLKLTKPHNSQRFNLCNKLTKWPFHTIGGLI